MLQATPAQQAAKAPQHCIGCSCEIKLCPCALLCSTNIGYAYCGSTNGVTMAVNSK